MIFSEAVTQVLGLVKRPDKEADAAAAVNSAISFFCLKNKFARDLVEATINVSPSAFSGSFNTATGLTRFRDFSYVKITGQKGYVNRRSPEQIFTPTGQMQGNCYYIAGSNMNYILPMLTPTLEVGYYQYPAVLTASDTHWLLDMVPYAVIYRAAAIVFGQIGDEASSNKYNGDAYTLIKVAEGDLALQNF